MDLVTSGSIPSIFLLSTGTSGASGASLSDKGSTVGLDVSSSLGFFAVDLNFMFRCEDEDGKMWMDESARIQVKIRAPRSQNSFRSRKFRNVYSQDKNNLSIGYR
ncbi:hypothetical protein PTKIN_Ptkin16aG0106300 [Pterospermum kingtungense]